MPTTYFENEDEARRAAAQSGGRYQQSSRSSGTTDADGNPIDTTMYGVVTDDGSPNPYADQGLDDWQNDLAGVPLVGWLSGADAAYDRAANRAEQEQAQSVWDALGGTAPTADDLTVNYGTEAGRDERGDLFGGESAIRGGSSGLAAQSDALGALRGIIDTGGYTRADQMQRNAAAGANAQRLQSANSAAMQQANARGMGGGGQELASRLMGSQAYAQGQSMADAQIQSAGMARALAAMQAAGQLGASMDQNEYRRQAALDAYNQRQMDWRREREQRNTQWRNRSAESRANAAQTSYENRERQAAGSTNQYQNAQSNRRQDAARQDQANENLGSALGTLAEIL